MGMIKNPLVVGDIPKNELFNGRCRVSDFVNNMQKNAIITYFIEKI